MPRPSVPNVKRQVVPPLNLEELKFWLRILEEHALFIQAGLPCDSTGLINEAETFRQELCSLLTQLDGVNSQRRFAQLVAEIQVVVGDFYRYNRRVLHLVLICELPGCNFALYLDHLSREAEYVQRLLDKLGAGQSPMYQVSSAREVAFWLRLMADHAQFVVHRLDPSERKLIEITMEFAAQFDELYLQGRDFVSMLRGEVEEVASFRRFLQDVRVSTARLRDFLRAAECLIKECKLVGIIPAQLADHLRREADHFMLILAMLEKSCHVPYNEDGDMEYLNLEETLATAEPVPPLPDAVSGPLQPMNYDAADEEEEDDEGDYAVRQAQTAPPKPPAPQPVMPVPPVPQHRPEPEPQVPEPQPPEAGKVKWGGKWPRPLGKKPE
ncbi:MAG: DUF2935 domain-containing protein [Negativicutes bacterium]|nr:DUF2935 domain-containing protein [Negativicutes bacterium]